MEERLADGYRGLRVYQTAFELALEVFEATRSFPGTEIYDLAAQLKASSRSVAALIAEGYGRNRYSKDFIRFLINAIGSTDETKVHLDFAQRHGYLIDNTHQRLLEGYEELGKQLGALIRSIEKKGSF